MRLSTILSIAFVTAVLVIGSCKTAPPPEAPKRANITNANDPVIGERATAIHGAINSEVKHLRDILADRQERTIEGIRFSTGKLRGKDVVIAWTGVGKVNAAMTTTLLIEHFKPKEIIFTGIAGGVDPNLGPGDIVIAHKTAHHDMGTLWPEGLFFRGVKNPLNNMRNPVFFDADEELVKLARRAGEKTGFRNIITVDGPREPKVVTGIIVSGDAFVASEEKCKEFREKLGADAVEMEGAAFAQICYQREIPHVVIRCLSDNADSGAIADSQTFYILAAENSSRLVSEMMSLARSRTRTDKKIDAR